MFEVFLCHSTADTEAAAAIAARLSRGTDIKPTLLDFGSAPDQTVVDVWDSGLSAGAILLLLSPDAVPPQKSRAAWKPVLDHVEQRQPPPIGRVLVRDCDIPLVLTRAAFFHWKHDPGQTLRDIESWVMQLDRDRDNLAFQPASLPRFTGRETELDLLWSSLVDHTGAVALVNSEPGSGKTTLAQQFAQAAQDHFRGIVWVDCADRAPEFMAGDLVRQLGAQVEVFGREAFVQLGEIARRRRLLGVLDDVRDPDVLAAASEGFCSVIVTTGSATLEMPPHVASLAIDPHPTGRAVQPPDADSPEGRLWLAMSVCRPNGFPLALACDIAGLSSKDASAACEHLLAAGCVDPLDAPGRTLRLPAHTRQALEGPAESGALRRRHAEILWSVFRQREDLRTEFAAELEHALHWAFVKDWSIAVPLARHAFNFFKEAQRPCEAALVFRRLRASALDRNDLAVVEQCDWELSWIEDSHGAIKSTMPPGEQLGFDFA